ncbi:unnamed protein product [Rotaria sp. Silwood2]|nr:unnamed protein product [Rotaria sp. Silwood2]CAF2884164.1 unnamed protein product [Rotaria sp. Silwood2]CAF3117453.1 unnamed protein product [Rotaria sp. Silwood2]CAF3280353.1 unnamed protein product [Rotaria sp. Silwood2]CAF3881115.1 unnamed protein product [Rotaria sp. Silwood2]
MSHNPNPKVDPSGFYYSTAAGKPTNIGQTHVGYVPPGDSSIVESSSSVPMTTTNSMLHSYQGPMVDRNLGKLGDEHGGAGTRTDDRKGEIVKNEGDTPSPTAEHYQQLS